MAARKAVEEELTRETIIQTAAEIFKEDGHKDVSMRKIAQRLGYSHGAIYYHFRDKADLFSAIIAHNFDEWIAELNRAASGIPSAGRTRLQELLLSFIRYGFCHKREYELMFVTNDPDLLAYSEAGRTALQEAFHQAVLDVLGLSGRNNPAYAMIPRSLFLSLHGFITYHLHKDDTFEEAEPQARAYARMLEAGLISMF